MDEGIFEQIKAETFLTGAQDKAVKASKIVKNAGTQDFLMQEIEKEL